MRTRQLRPGFFKNEDLAQCQPLARLLYAALWCIADREGRLEDRPARIKAEALAYDRDADPVALLNELERGGFIARYAVAGRKYLLIPTFKTHQQVHPHEAASEIPDPSQDVMASPDMSGNSLLSSVPSCLSVPSRRDANASPSPAEPATSASKPRQRDLLFDAIAAVTGADPALHGSRIGRIKKDLLRAKPPYSAEEIESLPTVIARYLHVDFALSMGNILQYVGWIRKPPAQVKGAKPTAKAPLPPGLSDAERERNRREAEQRKAAEANAAPPEVIREILKKGMQKVDK